MTTGRLTGLGLHLKAFLLAIALTGLFLPDGTAQTTTDQKVCTDPAYIRWLEERSMLFQARAQARLISGQGVQWRHTYGSPKPREAVKLASVWLLDYPGSVITQP